MCVVFKVEIAYYQKKLPLAALGPGTCPPCASPHHGNVQEYHTSAALSVQEGVTCLRECFASPLGALGDFVKYTFWEKKHCFQAIQVVLAL